jgi:2-oxoglutarate ferredoxin oxidoreductase subunit alpha
MDKRFLKLKAIESQLPEQLYLNEPGAKLTFISFGSTKGAILRSRALLLQKGISANFLHLSWLWPFPKKQVKAILDLAPNPVIVEANQQGQLAKLIAQETGVIIDNRINRYDGRPFYAEDILNFITDHFKL